MKKIGFVIPWYYKDIRGGAEQELRGLVQHLHAAGVEVEVITTCVKEFASDWTENYFKEGTEVEFVLSSVEKDNVFHVIPYEMENWTERMMFQAGDDMQDLTLAVGNTGMITLILDSRENVLRVPVYAVHTAAEKNYVYVEGDNGIREAKWVTVGLEGNDYAEIVEGLEEGDLIIVK